MDENFVKGKTDRKYSALYCHIPDVSSGASEAIRLVRPEPYHFLLQVLLLKRPNPV